AALRRVAGAPGEQDVRANIEIKCFDLAANPYLVAGSLISAGLAGLAADATLPEEITGDPAGQAARAPPPPGRAGGRRARPPWPRPAAGVAGGGRRVPGGQRGAARGDGRPAAAGV